MVTEWEAKNLIQYHKTHKHLRSVGDGSDYRAIDYIHIHTQWVRDVFNRVGYNAVGHIKKESDQTVYPEMIALNEWEIGGVQDPHLDTYSTVELNNDAVEDKPSREWTLILYLNENFKGGETYFPEQNNHIHEPKAREGILFQGLYHEHGVFPVRRNSRHTISMWFSTNPDMIITDERTKDLELDHYKLRNI